MSTSVTHADITTEMLQKMMEIGYVAAGSGQWMEAAAIFDGIQAARPDSEFPDIGMAVVLLNAGRQEEAVRTLRDSLQEHPSSELVKSFLGLALREAGLTSESDRYLHEVIQSNQDESAVALAQSLLNPAND